MRVSILTIPFKLLTRSLEHQKNIKFLAPLTQAEMHDALLISKAIKRSSQYTPWKSTCLVQALTAHRMLYRSNIPGVFYVGISKNKSSDQAIKAHAWSKCGNQILTGANEHQFYTVISVFLWKKRYQN